MKQRGFTLIELMVALSLFVIVLGISSSIFIRSLRSQRAIINLISVNDNSSLAIEQMAREVRTGTNFSANPPDNNQLSFTNALSKAVIYRLNITSGAIERNEDGGVFSPITSANVRVEKLNFILSGAGVDSKQARITVAMRVGSTAALLQNFYTDVQTTLSPRILDN